MTETALQRLAREITVMMACGGPLSSQAWIQHVAVEIGRAHTPSDPDIAQLACRFGGSSSRAVSFIGSLEAALASVAANPDAAIWRPGSRARALLETDLELVARACNAP